MATIKAFTDLEQSKKLAEFLPFESADMHYHYDSDFDELESIPSITEEDDHFVLFPKDIRCWSLAALLGVLPDYTLQTNTDGTVFVVCESKKPMISDAYDNPIDACYEMTVKLHELNLL